MVVTGTPQLTRIFIGGNYRQAAYDAARSKGTQVVFSYSVQAGDYDGVGYIESSADCALSLDGGRIASADGIRMQIFSPAPSPILSITTELMEAEAVVVRIRAAAVRTPVGAVRIRAAGAIPIPVCG